MLQHLERRKSIYLQLTNQQITKRIGSANCKSAGPVLRKDCKSEDRCLTVSSHKIATLDNGKNIIQYCCESKKKVDDV
jgi:hypothetical protein